MPFAGDLPDNNFATYKAEMVRWKCKWQNVTEKPSTLIKVFIAWSKFRGISGWTCIKDKPLSLSSTIVER
jgi:hypothetical protein